MAFFWITQREWERATAKIEQLEERTVANTKLLERHADAIDKIHEARSKPFKTLGYMLKVAVPALAAVLLMLVTADSVFHWTIPQSTKIVRISTVKHQTITVQIPVTAHHRANQRQRNRRQRQRQRQR